MNSKKSGFSIIFKKINGFKVMKQYLRSGVFFFAIFQVLSQGFTRKSLEIARNSIDNRVVVKFKKKYKNKINEIKNEIDLTLEYDNKKANIIWICWLQGIENAPEIVKKCIASVKNNIKDKEIVIITEKNYQEYIKFPDHILHKIKSGNIYGAHFSDLIRLELLTRYGGTWIDATVYISDNNFPDFILDSDLFLFQKLKPALDGNPLTISNWFITSKASHPMLIMTRELLYDYWSNHDSVVHYFIFHIFFQIVIDCYPDEWKQVIPSSSSTPHILQLRLFDNYNERLWLGIKQQTSIHKLSYKFKNSEFEIEDTFFQHLFK